MKKLFSILLALMLCVSISGCGLAYFQSPIWSEHELILPDEEDAMYYNGRKYIEHDFGFTFYVPEFEANWVHIATKPWDSVFYALLGTVTEFYGDDADNPTVITSSRGGHWFREDIVLDCNSTLSVYDSEEYIPFSISEITTGNKLVYTEEFSKQAQYQKGIRVSFTKCPLVTTRLTFYTIADTLYLQIDYATDYCEVTEEFAAILAQLEDYT